MKKRLIIVGLLFCLCGCQATPVDDGMKNTYILENRVLGNEIGPVLSENSEKENYNVFKHIVDDTIIYGFASKETGVYQSIYSYNLETKENKLIKEGQMSIVDYVYYENNLIYVTVDEDNYFEIISEDNNGNQQTLDYGYSFSNNENSFFQSNDDFIGYIKRTTNQDGLIDYVSFNTIDENLSVNEVWQQRYNYRDDLQVVACSYQDDILIYDNVVENPAYYLKDGVVKEISYTKSNFKPILTKDYLIINANKYYNLKEDVWVSLNQDMFNFGSNPIGVIDNSITYYNVDVLLVKELGESGVKEKEIEKSAYFGNQYRWGDQLVIAGYDHAEFKISVLKVEEKK